MKHENVVRMAERQQLRLYENQTITTMKYRLFSPVIFIFDGTYSVSMIGSPFPFAIHTRDHS